MTPVAQPVTITPLLGIPEVRQGDDIADLVLRALQHNEIRLMDGDMMVVSSKVVSKALGLRAPAGSQPEVVLSQTVRIVAERMTPSGVTRIVESAAGPVMTAAGVDASNTNDQSTVLVLPHDPDAVAAQIRDGVQSGWATLSGSHVITGIVISDTAGRPWRNGQTDFALGVCGLQAVEDLRGSHDTGGRLLSVTERCVADEIASAADLVKGKATGVPAAHIRGLGHLVLDGDDESSSGAGDLVRTGPQDWFGYGMVEAVRAALGVQPGSTAASEAGIPFIFREDAVTRAARALRVALLACPGAVSKVSSDTIELTARNDFALGVAAARAEVALRGEGLTTTLTHAPAPALETDDLLTSRARVLIVFQ